MEEVFRVSLQIVGEEIRRNAKFFLVRETVQVEVQKWGVIEHFRRYFL
jgi:hypothetical protein